MIASPERHPQQPAPMSFERFCNLMYDIQSMRTEHEANVRSDINTLHSQQVLSNLGFTEDKLHSEYPAHAIGYTHLCEQNLAA